MRSNKVFTIELSQESANDLIDIQNYTYTFHGENQWELYNSKLKSAFLKIKKNPLIGHKRVDLPDNFYSWNVEKHLIVYKISDNIIFIIRILYQKMDILNY